jgi:ATP-binding cassette subfamily C (CFTR/MRP) protein 1
MSIMAAKGGSGLSSSQIALCLTYMVSITQILGMVTRQTAEMENNSKYGNTDSADNDQ